MPVPTSRVPELRRPYQVLLYAVLGQSFLEALVMRLFAVILSICWIFSSALGAPSGKQERGYSSVAHMLSDIFIEPQKQRPSRSSPKQLAPQQSPPQRPPSNPSLKPPGNPAASPPYPPRVPQNVRRPSINLQRPVYHGSGFPNRGLRTPLRSSAPPLPPPPLKIPQKYLPPPFPVAKRECLGINGSLIGECIDPYTCDESGGKPVGLCPGSGPPSVCCFFTSFCNYMSNVERAYLNSPNYPQPINNVDSCAFQMSPLEDVCQVRIDFLDFHLKPPTNGVCEDDNALHIQSNDPNAFIPTKKLCGTLSKDQWDPLSEDVPHMYIHFKSINSNEGPSHLQPPKRLKFPGKPENLVSLHIRVKNFLSSWNLRITQISCGEGARLQAPDGCAQYYTGENGTISSFNYGDGLYASESDITSCIRNEPAACGINYVSKSRFSVGGNFEGLSFGLQCPGDYVQFSGQKAAFCGSLSTDDSFSFKSNNGPHTLHLHSDQVHTPTKDVGFNFTYKFLYHCQDSVMFDYSKYSI